LWHKSPVLATIIVMRYFILLFLITFSACKKTETEPELMASIAEVQSQIEEMIRPQQCATTASNCRIKDINSFGGCGPTYVYNVNDVDPAKLAGLFVKLEKLHTEYFKMGKNLSYCYRIVPNTVYADDCKCKAEFRIPEK
jgi:hypothetical protein